MNPKLASSAAKFIAQHAIVHVISSTVTKPFSLKASSFALNVKVSDLFPVDYISSKNIGKYFNGQPNTGIDDKTAIYDTKSYIYNALSITLDTYFSNMAAKTIMEGVSFGVEKLKEAK